MNIIKSKSIETLLNAVAWDYFKRVLNWPTGKIAYELYLNERRLIEWVNKRPKVITDLMKSETTRVKAIRSELEKKYPLPKETPRERLSLNINKIVKAHKDGNSLNQIAKKFKCNQSVFKRWWSENLPIINQEVRKESQ